MTLGEVWQASLSGGAGREQAGTRPVLIVQDDHFAQASPLIVVVPFTSQLAASRFPGAVRVDPSAQNGLRVPSIAMVFQIRAIDRTALTRRVGVLAASELQRIAMELKRLFGSLL
jgi:mRNA interferase MazF